MPLIQTRSRVVLQDSQTEPVVAVAAQLLRVLGHDVSLAEGPDAALAAAAEEPTDLLVLNITDPVQQGHCLEQLALLPAPHRPLQVAILSDEETETAILLQRKLPGVKVHVFVKHVHALGLLTVIKRLALVK